jgi:hypothetical protein
LLGPFDHPANAFDRSRHSPESLSFRERRAFMAYRSDLEAARARLDAMEPRAPCPACELRRTRLRRVAWFVLGAFLYLAAFVLLAFASLAGFIALIAVLIGTVILCGRGGGNPTCFLAGIAFAFVSAGGFMAFFYLERLLRFDVGRFG